MTIREKRKLKRVLPAEYRKQIAKTLGFSARYVDMVLHGSRNNNAVIDAAIDMAKQLKIKSIRQQKIIKAL
jgi:transcriptional regulator with XRE-family HTH domain